MDWVGKGIGEPRATSYNFRAACILFIEDSINMWSLPPSDVPDQLARLTVDREYDLFEVAEGVPVWRGHAAGLLEARAKLLEISHKGSNECFAMHLPTKEIVARLNVRTDDGRKPVVFQIIYEYNASAIPTEKLRLLGYEVDRIVGNQAAKVVLSMQHQCDLFIVGHAAPDETRIEMVDWLKTKYPGVPVIALIPQGGPAVPGAAFNADLNDSESLLRLIATAIRRRFRTELPGGSGC